MKRDEDDTPVINSPGWVKLNVRRAALAQRAHQGIITQAERAELDSLQLRSLRAIRKHCPTGALMSAADMEGTTVTVAPPPDPDPEPPAARPAATARRPRCYFVWRQTARQPFLAYRATRRWPVPEGHHNLIWSGDCYKTALEIQKTMNLWCPVRHEDHPDQRLLPEFKTLLVEIVTAGLALKRAGLA